MIAWHCLSFPHPTLFSDPIHTEKPQKLDAVFNTEFHGYTVGDFVLPKRAAAV
ncbi:hypothetical protein HFO15_13680 [Rhizobium laguerreae]|uniref:hypothetical protein n=1 Tax=Rhizobium laguerreae TaxID=1076926 RepID=UPI001C902520|nr:hypothetical protein [Rhizobium laguerreae]MBY3338272.1 hypothetical protein [Rhizobium laguerreae]